MSRYSLRPHSPCSAYPHEGGWAVHDAEEGRQVGWYAHEDRAAARVAERNGQPAPLPPPQAASQAADVAPRRVEPVSKPQRASPAAERPVRGVRPYLRQLAGEGVPRDEARRRLAERGMVIDDRAFERNYKLGLEARKG